MKKPEKISGLKNELDIIKMDLSSRIKLLEEMQVKKYLNKSQEEQSKAKLDKTLDSLEFFKEELQQKVEETASRCILLQREVSDANTSNSSRHRTICEIIDKMKEQIQNKSYSVV